MPRHKTIKPVSCQERKMYSDEIPSPETEKPTEKKRLRKLSMEKREKIRSLLQDGTSRRQISRIMNVATSVICRFATRLKETGGIEDRHKIGRPKKYHEPSEHWTNIGGDRKYQCAHCQKTFAHFVLVQEHIRVHTGERPFKCDQCFRGFARSSTLKRHLICHSNERLYMCDICAKCFAEASSLRVHIRTHTGERPYRCQFCDRGCTTSGNLNAHMRVHRDQISKQSELCVKMAEKTINRSGLNRENENRIGDSEDEENMTHMNISENIEKAIRQEERDKEGNGISEDIVGTCEERRARARVEFEREMHHCEHKMEETCPENTQQERCIVDVYQVKVKQEPQDMTEECQ
ncbi:zinc finger protein 680-like [Haliotis rubra]|uniref:zinc finger protein 680-like n=1 Tax=Haliotis rubra TaxID=36100 RepID=UPI001EE60A6B|nr:zinc finger protein 680-like [Haliotis rubra]XP_046559131.1 zinc finger protein 680-like [Haliotis rubra]